MAKRTKAVKAETITFEHAPEGVLKLIHETVMNGELDATFDYLREQCQTDIGDMQEELDFEDDPEARERLEECVQDAEEGWEWLCLIAPETVLKDCDILSGDWSDKQRVELRQALPNVRNEKGEAVDVESYKTFIVKVVNEHKWAMPMSDIMLDRLIEERFKDKWGPTDLAPWGKQKHPKWKQNVASAKCVLHKSGEVISYYGYRIGMSPIAMEAVKHWLNPGQAQKKKRYKPLKQPKRVRFAPVAA